MPPELLDFIAAASQAGIRLDVGAMLWIAYELRLVRRALYRRWHPDGVPVHVDPTGEPTPIRPIQEVR